MRVEMLGTAFTAQHSDARVLDQYVFQQSLCALWLVTSSHPHTFFAIGLFTNGDIREVQSLL